MTVHRWPLDPANEHAQLNDCQLHRAGNILLHTTITFSACLSEPADPHGVASSAGQLDDKRS